MLISVSVRLIKVKKAPQDLYTVRIGQYAFENKDDNIHKKRSVKKTESPKKFSDVQ